MTNNNLFLGLGTHKQVPQVDPPFINPAFSPTAVEYDGVNTYLSATSLSIFNSATCFLSAWVKIPEENIGTGNRYIATIGGGIAGGSPGFTLALQAESTAADAKCRAVSFGFNVQGGQMFLINGSYIVPRNQWVHIFASIDLFSSRASFYLDGVNDPGFDFSAFVPLNQMALSLGDSFIGQPTPVGGAATRFRGAIAQLVFDNRIPNDPLFIMNALRSDIKPRDIGPAGTGITTYQPAIFLAGNAAGYGVNSGYAGDFTVNEGFGSFVDVAGP